MGANHLFYFRVNLAITNNPKGGLFRAFRRAFTCCTMQVQLRSISSKIIEKSSPLWKLF